MEIIFSLLFSIGFGLSEQALWDSPAYRYAKSFESQEKCSSSKEREQLDSVCASGMLFVVQDTEKKNGE